MLKYLYIIFIIIFVFQPSAVWSQAGTDAGLIDVTTLDSTIVVELRYATPYNFLNERLYPKDAPCLLQREVAQKLVKAQQILQQQGFGLKVWDAYRPLSVQIRLWEKLPNPRFVAPPSRGSRHNRAAAVDVTLVDSLGQEVKMPTGFDDFSPLAAPGHPDVPTIARLHCQILHDAMKQAGFRAISSEWWHFDAIGYRKFPILDIPFKFGSDKNRNPDS